MLGGQKVKMLSTQFSKHIYIYATLDPRNPQNESIICICPRNFALGPYLIISSSAEHFCFEPEFPQAHNEQEGRRPKFALSLNRAHSPKVGGCGACLEAAFCNRHSLVSRSKCLFLSEQFYVKSNQDQEVTLEIIWKRKHKSKLKQVQLNFSQSKQYVLLYESLLQQLTSHAVTSAHCWTFPQKTPSASIQF